MPSRTKAKVVLSGPAAASRRRALSGSSSRGERMPTWRASTTLSSRPRPTAPAKRPTSRSQPCRSGCSPVIARGAPAGRATRAPRGGGKLEGACRQRVPLPGEDPRLGRPAGGEGGSHEHPGPAAGEGQGGQHQRGRPERRPRPAGGGHAPAKAQPAEQHGARATGQVGEAAGRAGEAAQRRLLQHLGPGARGRREPVRSCGLDGPRPTDPHDRGPFRRLEPERRLEVGLAGRGEERDRIQVGDRDGGHAQPPPEGLGRRLDCRGKVRLAGCEVGPVDHRHRAEPADPGDPADPGPKPAPIRASGTPTLRSSRSRRVG